MSLNCLFWKFRFEVWLIIILVLITKFWKMIFISVVCTRSKKCLLLSHDSDSAFKHKLIYICFVSKDEDEPDVWSFGFTTFCFIISELWFVLFSKFKPLPNNSDFFFIIRLTFFLKCRVSKVFFFYRLLFCQITTFCRNLTYLKVFF